jgi:hypothetical protein
MNSALTIAAATTAAGALVGVAAAVEPVYAAANPIGLGATQQTQTFGDPVAAAGAPIPKGTK